MNDKFWQAYGYPNSCKLCGSLPSYIGKGYYILRCEAEECPGVATEDPNFNEYWEVMESSNHRIESLIEKWNLLNPKKDEL